ncbi:MAG: sugar phosphate isomerase/epimerase [Spirochaetales bacterium]
MTPSIPIGTLVKGDESCIYWIRTLAQKGFQCFSIMFWETLGTIDMFQLRDQVLEAVKATHTFISALSVYGNPLQPNESGKQTLQAMKTLIEIAPSLNCPIVSGFAGRVPGTSVPESIEPWKTAFEPLMEMAEQCRVQIAFENCRLGDTWKTGKWNIAINPDAWELMFNAIPSRFVGLEWEPCHQVEALADPLLQLKQWVSRIIHIHGKDARIDKKLIAERGIYASRKYYASCFPGNGDTDWSIIFQILKHHGYKGTVDIEGWNDAEWSGDREIEGQCRALDYLISCQIRGTRSIASNRS